MGAPIIMLRSRRSWSKFSRFFRGKAIANQTSFKITLAKDATAALDVLEAVPLLAYDFQILIDGRGNLYQFDLDRVFVGGLYHHEKRFDKTFVKLYDSSTRMLRRMKAWSAWEGHQLEGNSSNDEERRDWDTGSDDRKKGNTVLMDHLNNSTSLSCRAVDRVDSMMGRIGVEGKVRNAKLMMVHTVQKIMFDEDRGQYGDRSPDRNEDGMWNCSL